VSELVKVIVVGPSLPGARLFAFGLTVNVTVVPVDAEPEVVEGVSQSGMPEIE
jgi:hypothetical protein